MNFGRRNSRPPHRISQENRNWFEGRARRTPAENQPTPTPPHILVSEDPTDIRDLLVMNLRSAGYEVSAVGDGEQALARPLAAPADLLMLDLMMPRLGGLEVCKALRAKGNAAPILMLTAKSIELDRVLGLELGADDYLTQPFAVAELLACVKALLRRADLLAPAQASNASGHAKAAAAIRNGELEFLPAKRQVRCRSLGVDFTALEYDLLLHFASHPGHVSLRSPLTAPVACLERLDTRCAADSAAAGAEDRRLIEIALRNTRNAAWLVQSLGDSAKLDEPKFKLHAEVVAVHDADEMQPRPICRICSTAFAKAAKASHRPPAKVAGGWGWRSSSESSGSTLVRSRSRAGSARARKCGFRCPQHRPERPAKPRQHT